MGGSQSSEQKTEIINDTSVQTALKNVNENINEMTMKVIQENVSKTAAGAKIKQSMTISGLKAEGDIEISNISQKAAVEISLSSFTNSELQQDLVTETMNELQTKLQESMKMSQDAAESQGEQFVAELAGALKGAYQSVTGTSVDEKKELSIQNLLNIESETELVNITKQAINSELINKTVSEIANQIVGEQEMEISNIESETGGIVVSNIEQEILTVQMLEAINSVGTGSEIISAIGNVSKAEIEKSIEAGQVAEAVEIGTIDAAGGFVEQAVGAWTNLVQTGALTVLLPILIIGALVLFMFRGVIGKVAEQQSTAYAQQKYQQQQPMMMTGGSKKIKSLYKRLMKTLKPLLKTIKKYSKKYITKRNIIIAIIAIIVGGASYMLYKKIRYNRIEGFTAESKLDEVKISSNGKYLKNKKLGLGDLCLNADESNAFKFDISIINDKDVYIVTKRGDDKLYMKAEGGKIIVEKYDLINDSSYKFQYKNIKENTYILKHGDKYIASKEDCLVLTDENKDKIQLDFE